MELTIQKAAAQLESCQTVPLFFWIRKLFARRREIGRFITKLEKLPKTVSESDDARWGQPGGVYDRGQGQDEDVHADWRDRDEGIGI